MKTWGATMVPMPPRVAQGVYALAALACVTALAMAYRQGLWVAGFVACLAMGVFPCLDRFHESGSVRHSSSSPGPLWGMVVLFVAGLLVVPYLGILAVVRGYLGSLVLHPSIADTARWWLAKAPAVLILAALEEWFFRGWLQCTVFEGRRRAVPLAAGVFAVAHALTWSAWLSIPAWFASGWVLGWCVKRAGGRLAPAIALHAAGNLFLQWFRDLLVLNLPFAVL